MLERVCSHWLAGLVFIFALSLIATSNASAETRTLKLHFTHTNERAEVTFKRNGRYVREGLDKINWTLRDWRQNEATEMDPRLLDLLWEVYQRSGSRDYIHVVSAYRSPATNQMLRSRSSGVADNSQHTRGRAIDFFLPDVPTQRLRNLGLQHHGGGVGYYPRSGSPFVHLDTGSVRHWPRMNRQQLSAVFPDGRTMHVPSDGRPLPGYEQAVAAYEARQRNQSSIQIASAGSASAGSGRGLLSAIFGRGSSSSQQGSSSDAQTAQAQPAQQARPAQQVQQAQQAQTAESRPETQPRRPGEIVAALPPSRIPVPRAAPRPSQPVGAETPTENAVARAEEHIPFEVRDEDSAPAVIAAANVPVPVGRPDRASATAPAETDDGPVVADALTAMAALAPRPRERSGSEAIEEMLAAKAEADVMVAAPPLPRLRPPGAQVVSASLDVKDAASAQGDVFALAAPPDTRMGSIAGQSGEERIEAETLKQEALAAIQDRRSSPAATASPRTAIMDRAPGTNAAQIMESGVRTTAKTVRPGPQHVGQTRRAVQRPVVGERAQWAFATGSIQMARNGTQAPSFAHRAVRDVPRTVYTTGFRQSAGIGEANRFSGQAVRFISVARFDRHTNGTN